MLPSWGKLNWAVWGFSSQKYFYVCSCQPHNVTQMTHLPLQQICCSSGQLAVWIPFWAQFSDCEVHLSKRLTLKANLFPEVPYLLCLYYSRMFVITQTLPLSHAHTQTAVKISPLSTTTCLRVQRLQDILKGFKGSFVQPVLLLLHLNKIIRGKKAALNLTKRKEVPMENKIKGLQHYAVSLNTSARSCKIQCRLGLTEGGGKEFPIKRERKPPNCLTLLRFSPLNYFCTHILPLPWVCTYLQTSSSLWTS